MGNPKLWAQHLTISTLEHHDGPLKWERQERLLPWKDGETGPQREKVILLWLGSSPIAGLGQELSSPCPKPGAPQGRAEQSSDSWPLGKIKSEPPAERGSRYLWGRDPNAAAGTSGLVQCCDWTWWEDPVCFFAVYVSTYTFSQQI